MTSTPTPEFGGANTIVAAPESEGERLDRFLAQSFATLTRSRIKNLILDGMARREGVTVDDPSELVQAGLTYDLTVPEAVAATPQPEDIPLTILYEDADLIVIDKPAGLVVHPAPGNLTGTLVNALLAHCGDSLTGIGGERRPGIVHRLDKETSGVMVAAKTDFAHAKLSETFANRDLDRHYLALCWGTMTPPAGDIEGAIGRDQRDRKRMAVRAAGGRAALTHYKTLQIWRLAVSLLDVKLSTGRTHQIRVHLANASHPVVGDPIYLRRIPAVSKGLPPMIRARLLDFPRQALHAASLSFTHPRSGEALSFSTEPPADFLALIDALNTTAGLGSDR
ncbi:RluA family pseudouridine synthase [Acidisoma cladoniae]|jgi:23S rRNA pseudouridine1911/1915/1917 synthase|uniref:RluA family pseudouridine synthase n=1 Tax=Acidisoma cladoniae TaxID=3040935 RepID=UPI00254B4248|nr:RluA family pseudouridine synthase [Acidisoma sp. PAMC 29798]